jgi:hypothetical protein
MIVTRAGATHVALVARALCSGLLATCLLLPQAASAGEAAALKESSRALRAAPANAVPVPGLKRALFERERASHDARQVADWIVHTSDNHAGDDGKLPFVIIDKKDARVYVFDRAGRLRGAAPALLGLARGDTALPGIGALELSSIAPKDRVTPAGRFIAELGTDSNGEDILWVDYEGALAMHRVITTNPKERRAQRLATATPLDNRISYGCINIPVTFYEKVVVPSFAGTKGIVYVLPETKLAREVFASYDIDEHARLMKLQSQAAMMKVSPSY